MAGGRKGEQDANSKSRSAHLYLSLAKKYQQGTMQSMQLLLTEVDRRRADG